MKTERAGYGPAARLIFGGFGLGRSGKSLTTIRCLECFAKMLRAGCSKASETKILTGDGKIEDYPTRIDGKPIKAWSMLKDREGNLWFGTDGQGIVHSHDQLGKVRQ